MYMSRWIPSKGQASLPLGFPIRFPLHAVIVLRNELAHLTQIHFMYLVSSCFTLARSPGWLAVIQ